MKSALFPFACFLFFTGCATNSSSTPPITRASLMSIPIEQSGPDYWFNKPAVTSIESADFQKLWDACRETLIDDQFEISDENYRLGLMSTWPLLSKQFFEIWRSDAGTAHDVAQDSLQSIRRSVHFEFARLPDGSFIAHPQVVMEQSSHPERRITVQAQFSQAFSAVGETASRANIEGASVPSRYWYALGRDEAMEKELANSVREKLKS
jgi:hypothetical protein